MCLVKRARLTEEDLDDSRLLTLLKHEVVVRCLCGVQN